MPESTKQSKPADPKADVAEKVSDATYGGQAGEIVELKADEKPDPTTIAHVQVLPE